jgi:HEPN domain-containing protein
MVWRCMSASPPEEASPAQRWFALAIEDLAAARILIADGSAALRIAGFLAQQAAEKALKAGLFAASIGVPRIHGLNQLLGRYPNVGAPEVDPDDLDLLDPWVIDGRYAADLPDLGRAEADELLQAAHRVVDAVAVAQPSLKRSASDNTRSAEQTGLTD